MGAKIQDVQHGMLYCEADNLKGCDIQLDYPSVGATENIMLAAVYADGDTYIRNAAKEPEIIDLQNFLIGTGVNVSGAGTGVIRIVGSNKKLNSVQHNVIPDRIVAGTYMLGAAITGGDVVFKNVIPEHISSMIHLLRESGCVVDVRKNTVHVIGAKRPRAIDSIRTLPYPGFPTDMQAQMLSYLTVARGTSIIVETVFENRYKHVDELIKMGSNIRIEGRLAVIKGVKMLTGASVNSKDLRGGAALILAGLAADGETIVNGTKHIDRGYEIIEEKLSKIGAKIIRQ